MNQWSGFLLLSLLWIYLLIHIWLLHFYYYSFLSFSIYCYTLLKFFNCLTVKDAYDYQGRSFLHIPQDVGVNLKSDEPPEKCYIPKKLLHTWTGHSKGVSAIKFFPKSAHLLLSCSMDCRVKVSFWSDFFQEFYIRLNF